MCFPVVRRSLNHVEKISKLHYMNTSIRRIRLNSRILLDKKIGVNSIYKVKDVYVYLDIM